MDKTYNQPIIFDDYMSGLHEGRYDSRGNLASRARSLYTWGHDSSVWGFAGQPPQRGHVIEILAPNYVSRPCWDVLFETADQIETIKFDFSKHVEWEVVSEQENIYQFFFSNIDTAKKMALKVQKSARNKRKDLDRRIRLDEAGGFHNKWAINRLFKIQEGRCYYSGEKLTRHPKNYVVDHIQAIYLGGTDWPLNLALVIKEINTWKGGLKSSNDTLKWLAKKRGSNWLNIQKKYCLKVDKRRAELDLEFRQRFDSA